MVEQSCCELLWLLPVWSVAAVFPACQTELSLTFFLYSVPLTIIRSILYTCERAGGGGRASR